MCKQPQKNDEITKEDIKKAIESFLKEKEKQLKKETKKFLYEIIEQSEEY